MKDFVLSPLDLEELRAAHRQAKTKREAYRINAVILLGTGWTRVAVSEALLLEPKTLDHYVKRYREGLEQAYSFHELSAKRLAVLA